MLLDGGKGCRLGWTFLIAGYPLEANGVTIILYMGMYLVQEGHTNGSTLVQMAIILFCMYFIH